MLKTGLRIMLILTAALVGFSFMGRLHPAGDSFSVIRYPLVVMMLLLAVLIGRWAPARLLALVAIALLIGRGAMMRDWDEVTAPDMILYQKNLLFREADRSAFIADVRESSADFVTLQELSAVNRPILDALQDIYPHQVVCSGTAVGGVAVLSRWPILLEECSAPAGVALIEAETPSGPVRVVSLHLHWPWPKQQMPMLERVLPMLEGRAPMLSLVGGDFNMQPWGQSLDLVEDALGVRRVGHVERSFEVEGLYPVTIDHIMAGPAAQGSVEVRPRLGSDHFGVLGRIAFPS